MQRRIESQAGACADRPCHRCGKRTQPGQIQADAGACRKLEVAFEHCAAGGQVPDHSIELQRAVGNACGEVRKFAFVIGRASVFHVQYRFQAPSLRESCRY